MDLLDKIKAIFFAIIDWFMRLIGKSTPPVTTPTPVTVTTPVTTTVTTPDQGIANMDLSAGIANMDLSAGIANMNLFSPISVPVVTPPTPVVPTIIVPLPPNSLVLINDGREYLIKGKYQNQDVTLFDVLRFGKGSSDLYTIGQIVLFRFTDPTTKTDTFVNLKITKFYTKFEQFVFGDINAKYFTAQIVENYSESFIGIH